jgi:hypothetical protein
MGEQIAGSGVCHVCNGTGTGSGEGGKCEACKGNGQCRNCGGTGCL